MSKKNILFYVPNISQEYGGIRQYSAGLMKLFPELDDKYNFFILHDGKDLVMMDIINSNNGLKLIKPGDYAFSKKEIIFHKLKYLYNRTKSFLVKKISYNKEEVLDKILKIFKIDILHVPYQYLPSIKGVKMITTMHDVQELYFPEFFTAEERAYRATNYLEFIKKADKVVVSYKHVKDDIIRFFNKNSKDVDILLLKMDNLWFNKFENKPVKNDSKLPLKFILYPANFWLHKNHLNLVKAINFLREEKELSVNLILTGDESLDTNKVVREYIREKELNNQIHILGIIDEEKLYQLYKTTSAVVIPTLYEAGSFPLMESILMGVPVICANTTSLPETIGNHKFIFDPNSVEDIADKIEKIWCDENYTAESRENNKTQALALIDTNAKETLEKIYSF